jgi:hypothetical protein
MILAKVMSEIARIKLFQEVTIYVQLSKRSKTFFEKKSIKNNQSTK